jgi:hypothetical protein
MRGNLKNLSWEKHLLGPNTITNVSTLLTTTSLDAQEREGSMVKVKKIFKIQILRKAHFH